MTGCRDWPNTQSQASYKGVDFEVEEDEAVGGRNLVPHEFPGSETWVTEDTGNKHKRFSVSGYVVGEHADTHAQVLITALGSYGVGLLRLPLRPPCYVRCERYSSRFNETIMGRFDFSAEFILEPAFSIGFISLIFLAGAVVASVALGIAAASDSFSVNFDTVMKRFSPISRVPAVAREAAAETIILVAAALQSARQLCVLNSDSAAADVDFAIRNLANNASDLAYQGQMSVRIEAEIFVADEEDVESGFAGEFTRAVKLLFDNTSDANQLSEAMLILAEFEAQAITINIDCLSVRAEKDLTEEIAKFVRRVGVLYRAQALTKVKFSSRPEGVTARADIVTEFDALLNETDGSAIEDAIMEARNAIVQYLSKSVAELPALIEVEYARPLPAVVIATTLYNDASRDTELIARNRADHPLFMPKTLQAVRL